MIVSPKIKLYLQGIRLMHNVLRYGNDQMHIELWSTLTTTASINFLVNSWLGRLWLVISILWKSLEQAMLTISF